MSDIETAGQHLPDCADHGNCDCEETIRDTARDAAVAREARMALLDELIALDDATTDTYTIYKAVAILRRKYEKEPDGEA